MNPGLEGPFYASYGHGISPTTRRLVQVDGSDEADGHAPDVGRGFMFTHFNGRLRNLNNYIKMDIVYWYVYWNVY